MTKPIDIYCSTEPADAHIVVNNFRTSKHNSLSYMTAMGALSNREIADETKFLLCTDQVFRTIPGFTSYPVKPNTK
jgi:hypothetical protein